MNLLTATTVLLNLSASSQKVAQVVQRAHMEGRDITDEEMAQLDIDLDGALSRLDKAIEEKGG